MSKVFDKCLFVFLKYISHWNMFFFMPICEIFFLKKDSTFLTFWDNILTLAWHCEWLSGICMEVNVFSLPMLYSMFMRYGKSFKGQFQGEVHWCDGIKMQIIHISHLNGRKYRWKYCMRSKVRLFHTHTKKNNFNLTKIKQQHIGENSSVKLIK